MKKQDIITLDDLFEKYKDHPDFLGGPQLMEVNQRGIVDDCLIHIIVRSGSIDELTCLLENGADINLVGDLGNTALHYAAMYNRSTIVLFLLKNNANRYIKNEFGQTSLHVATLENNVDIIKLLK
jgi:ankyrin repeat protein